MSDFSFDQDIDDISSMNDTVNESFESISYLESIVTSMESFHSNGKVTNEVIYLYNLSVESAYKQLGLPCSTSLITVSTEANDAAVFQGDPGKWVDGEVEGSLEKQKGVIVRLTEKIINFIKMIIGKITTFFKSLFSKREKVIKRCNELTNLISKAKDVKEELNKEQLEKYGKIFVMSGKQIPLNDMADKLDFTKYQESLTRGVNSIVYLAKDTVEFLKNTANNKESVTGDKIRVIVQKALDNIAVVISSGFKEDKSVYSNRGKFEIGGLVFTIDLPYNKKLALSFPNPKYMDTGDIFHKNGNFGIKTDIVALSDSDLEPYDYTLLPTSKNEVKDVVNKIKRTLEKDKKLADGFIKVGKMLTTELAKLKPVLTYKVVNTNPIEREDDKNIIINPMAVTRTYMNIISNTFNIFSITNMRLTQYTVQTSDKVLDLCEDVLILENK